MPGHTRTRPGVMSSPGAPLGARPAVCSSLDSSPGPSVCSSLRSSLRSSFRPGLGLGACLALGVCLVTLGGGHGTRVAHASRADYVGAEACGRCHAAAFAAWQASAHARAAESLGPSPEGRCLACHTTGEAPAGQVFFAGVTCESCHGPGAGYAPEDIMRNPHLARAVGLRDLSTPARRAALCSTCHRAATRLAPFDPESAYRRIEHQ